jgi:hypothetical protein
MYDSHPTTQPSRYPVPRAHRVEQAQELSTAQDDDDYEAFFPRTTADDDCEQEHRPSMDTAPENRVAVHQFILDSGQDLPLDHKKTKRKRYKKALSLPTISKTIGRIQSPPNKD